MSLEIPSLNGGTTIQLIGLPTPWPPDRFLILGEHQLADGKFVLGFSPEGTIDAKLVNGDGALINAVRTPRIHIADRPIAVLTVQWQDGIITMLRLNGIPVLPDGDADFFLESTHNGSAMTDFSAQNERARLDRYSVVLNLPDNPRRKDGGEAYMLSALNGEIEQIEDLLRALERGREAHVPGLAARLRLLTIGKPLGLLQHCAALYKLPLILYASHKPADSLPLDEAIFIFSSVSAEPNDFYRNPVDLDIWLKLPALKVGATIYTNRDAIKRIGDTIGAHRDAGIPQLIQALQMHRTRSGGTYRDVQRYVVDAAKAVLTLARAVISQAGSPPLQ